MLSDRNFGDGDGDTVCRDGAAAAGDGELGFADGEESGAGREVVPCVIKAVVIGLRNFERDGVFRVFLHGGLLFRGESDEVAETLIGFESDFVSRERVSGRGGNGRSGGRFRDVDAAGGICRAGEFAAHAESAVGMAGEIDAVVLICVDGAGGKVGGEVNLNEFAGLFEDGFCGGGAIFDVRILVQGDDFSAFEGAVVGDLGGVVREETGIGRGTYAGKGGEREFHCAGSSWLRFDSARRFLFWMSAMTLARSV